MNQEEVVKSNLIDKQKYIQEKYFINLRLERLRQNKDKEIEEYISKWVSNRPDFGALIRRDLEKSYEKKEKELEEKLKELDIKINGNSSEKTELNLDQNLKLEKDEINKEIEELTRTHNNLIKKLSEFNYVYDENNNIVNALEYKKLFDETNKIINQKYDLNNLLNHINDHFEVRKEENIEDDNAKNILLEKIYQDVMESVKQLVNVRIENNQLFLIDSIDDYKKAETKKRIKLPNGVYIDINDINNALKKYEKTEKGMSYKVNLIESNNKVFDDLLNQIKQYLINCSIVKLLSEKKLGFYDIKRVYGDEKALQFEKQVKDGGMKTCITSGNYVNLEEFSETLKEIIKAKGQSWIEGKEKQVIK